MRALQIKSYFESLCFLAHWSRLRLPLLEFTSLQSIERKKNVEKFLPKIYHAYSVEKDTDQYT